MKNKPNNSNRTQNTGDSKMSENAHTVYERTATHTHIILLLREVLCKYSHYWWPKTILTFNSIQIAYRKALNDDLKSFSLHTYRGQGAVGNYAHKRISFAYINASFYPFHCVSIEPQFKTISCMRRIARWPHEPDKLTHKPQALIQVNLNNMKTLSQPSYVNVSRQTKRPNSDESQYKLITRFKTTTTKNIRPSQGSTIFNFLTGMKMRLW